MPERPPTPSSAAPRLTSRQRGYTRRWDVAAKRFLAGHPLCGDCDDDRPVACRCALERRITAATVVDHKRPHKFDRRLFWDRSNWQALCYACHNAKSATERER